MATSKKTLKHRTTHTKLSSKTRSSRTAKPTRALRAKRRPVQKQALWRMQAGRVAQGSMVLSLFLILLYSGFGFDWLYYPAMINGVVMLVAAALAVPRLLIAVFGAIVVAGAVMIVPFFGSLYLLASILQEQLQQQEVWAVVMTALLSLAIAVPVFMYTRTRAERFLGRKLGVGA